MAKHRDAQFIEAIGIGETARVLGREYRVIHNWTVRGVPKDFETRLAFARLAETRGVALPANEFPSAVAPTAPEPHRDPAALAAILDQLGGHEAIAEGARIAVVHLEDMQAEGRIWPKHEKALTAFARTSGFDLDAEKLVMRALGPGARRTAA
jgi:hypothetical protein